MFAVAKTYRDIGSKIIGEQIPETDMPRNEINEVLSSEFALLK
jgi:hypothetical protein